MSANQIAASTKLAELIKAAAGSTPCYLGERRQSDAATQDQARPYFRISFIRLGGQTNVPARLYGVCVIECFAIDGINAWNLATSLTKALSLNVPGIVSNPPLSDYRLDDAGWIRGNDGAGGHVYCNVIFHYFD